MKAADLVEKFRYALDNKWGYIFGTAGDLWTKAKQTQKVNYMISHYGTEWEKNSEAKLDKYYRSAKDGGKWINHYVADCSGLFAWAFNKLGGYIAHGSNSIWKSYCSNKGNLVTGKRSDGKELLPGTAVFTDKNGDKTHIGLFIGSGKVIEAAGVDAGVCVSNVTAGKWKCWGELKKVEYEGGGGGGDEPEHLTIRRGSKGEAVKECQRLLAKLGYDLGSYGIDGDFGRATEAAVKKFQQEHGLTADGICGPKTWEALEKAEPSEKKYTVTITSLDLTQAKALCNNYPGSTYKEMIP
jgi:hypothetical protein